MTDAEQRPNVLFIITDQQRADHVGYAGNDVVRTPNLDALAARGMVFDNAWVANPICMPNRSSIVTGRMPSAHGVVANDRALDWTANTHIRRFRASGYRTALIGKSHLQNGMSRLTSSDTTDEPAVFDPYPGGWDELEFEERYLEDNLDWPDDFYGFDTAELAINHGAKVTGHHLLWALERGAKLEDLDIEQGPDAPRKRGSEHWWQIYEPPYDPEFHSTSFVADRTIAFIEEASGQGSPWLAWASFPDPHHPFTPPGEWYDKYNPDDMPLPDTFDDDLSGAPDFLKKFQPRTVHKMRQWVALTGATSPEVTRAAIAANYALIEMIDDRVGQILATLDRLGQTDNTIIVFTSDHGDMMGDHGFLLKGLMHYRGVLQVPYMIVDPRRGAGRTQALASSLDFGPTLMELCGIDGYHGLHGVSQTAVLDDPSQSVRESLMIEEDFDAPPSWVPTKIRSLITPTHRYTRYNTGDETLCELRTDDDERTNLVGADPGLHADMVGRLADSLIWHSDTARGLPSLAVARP